MSIDPHFPNHVCKLKKELYGLHQAPRAWFLRFSHFLISLGFRCSRADTSLFYFFHNGTIIYLLLYVDDIIVIGNDSSSLTRFIARVNKKFDVKRLEPAELFP